MFGTQKWYRATVRVHVMWLSWKCFQSCDAQTAFFLSVLHHMEKSTSAKSPSQSLRHVIKSCYQGGRGGCRFLLRTFISLCFTHCRRQSTPSPCGRGSAALGTGTDEMPPGLTALHVSLRQCLICKSLMAFNSHEWMGRDSIKSLSWASQTSQPLLSARQPHEGGREEGREKESESEKEKGNERDRGKGVFREWTQLSSLLLRANQPLPITTDHFNLVVFER